MDDLISRQALCRYALNQKDKSVTPNDIMRFPSADRPTGEWQVRFPYKDTGKIRVCSNCNITQTVNVYDGMVRFKFCPYCGAKMVSCEKCKHWESDTGYCYEIADSDAHECHFERRGKEK